MRKRSAMFWSGGKDSALALHIIRSADEIDVEFLVTTLSSEFKRISMHGIREEMLDKQSEAIGIPLHKMWVPNQPTNEAYEQELHRTLDYLKSAGIEYVIFGDIFLEDLKLYRDNILKTHGLTGIYPLWKQKTSLLIGNFLRLRFRTITCCISTSWLNESWSGREITPDFIDELPAHVDPCGENGEYHTFCFDGPIFTHPVDFSTGEKRFVPLTVKDNRNEESVSGFCYTDIY